MNFDCVIFDFNGTLFFDDDKHVAAWNQISEEIRGLGITPKELHENINGVPNQQTITGVLQQHMPSDSLKASCLAASELFLFLFFVILY